MIGHQQKTLFLLMSALSAGAVEYSDCISAKG